MATFINGYLVEKEERSFSRWQRLARSIASITIAFPANPPDRYPCLEDSLMRFRKAGSLYYSEKC